MMHSLRATEVETDKHIEWHRMRYYFHAEFRDVGGAYHYVNFKVMTVFWLTEGRLSMVTNQVSWDGAKRELYVRDNGRLPVNVSRLYEQWLAEQVLV